MRKDVRMGFAVGGVLLAVIIVAVLVIHRNKTPNNSVTLDLKGKTASVEGTGEVDVAPPVTSGKQPDSAQPLVAQPKSAPDDHARVKDRTGQDSGDSSDAGDKWNQLFVSTADDPIKEMTAKSRQKAKVQPAPQDSQGSGGAVSDLRGAGEVNPLIQPAVERHDVLADPAPTTRPASGRSIPRTHRVAQNETFASISRMVYGSERHIKAIQKANPTVNPAKLKPGMLIQLPSETEVKQGSVKSQEKAPAKSVTAASAPALSADASTYTVQSGDNLYKISRKLYGNGSRGEELYTANKDKIGPDSTRLKVGMVLQLPEKPTAVSSR